MHVSNPYAGNNVSDEWPLAGFTTSTIVYIYRRMYAKVLVKTKTTPEDTIFAIFDLLYLNHHNIPTIESLGAIT